MFKVVSLKSPDEAVELKESSPTGLDDLTPEAISAAVRDQYINWCARDDNGELITKIHLPNNLDDDGGLRLDCQIYFDDLFSGHTSYGYLRRFSEDTSDYSVTLVSKAYMDRLLRTVMTPELFHAENGLKQVYTDPFSNSNLIIEDFFTCTIDSKTNAVQINSFSFVQGHSDTIKKELASKGTLVEQFKLIQDHYLLKKDGGYKLSLSFLNRETLDLILGILEEANASDACDFKFEDVWYLNLFYSDLEPGADFLTKFQNVQFLDMVKCNLAALEDVFSTKQFPELRIVNVINNFLEALPVSLVSRRGDGALKIMAGGNLKAL